MVNTLTRLNFLLSSSAFAQKEQTLVQIARAIDSR